MLALALLLSAAGIDESSSFRDGVRLYETVQLEEAQQHFLEALPAAADDAERARVHCWLGLIHAQLGDSTAAKASFAEAVKLDARVALPAAAAPEVAALLEEARAAAAPAPAPIPEPATPAATPEAGVPWLAVGVGGAGAVLALAGAITFAVGLDTALVEAPKAEFQDVALQRVSTGYTEYAVGGALVAVGALALGGGALLLE